MTRTRNIRRVARPQDDPRARPLGAPSRLPEVWSEQPNPLLVLQAAKASLVRHSFLHSSRPMLLVGYHIEKTAGSALMKWLHKQANAPARLTCLFDYMTTNCFFALHPDLFPAFADAWTLERCGTLTAPNWTTSALALEFHGYSKYRYWSIFGRQLPNLRRKYASVGAPLITTTSVRDPMAHLVSSYLMWPPYKRSAPSRSTKAVSNAVPLPAWLPHAAGLQVCTCSPGVAVPSATTALYCRCCCGCPPACCCASCCFPRARCCYCACCSAYSCCQRLDCCCASLLLLC